MYPVVVLAPEAPPDWVFAQISESTEPRHSQVALCLPLAGTSLPGDEQAGTSLIVDSQK